MHKKQEEKLQKMYVSRLDSLPGSSVIRIAGKKQKANI